MTRAEDLRALADEVDRYDGLHTDYVNAQAEVRANPDDADAVVRYRTAKRDLDGHRTTIRAAGNRSGVSFGADMMRSEG